MNFMSSKTGSLTLMGEMKQKSDEGSWTKNPFEGY